MTRRLDFMEKVLITGITGFVGSHLADYLLTMPNIEVHGTKRWHLSRMDHVAHIEDKVVWHDCNILDARSCRKVINDVQPDIVFHMASESFVSPSWDNPRVYMDTNYLGTVNMLEAIREIKPDTKFHIPGSGEEYGEIYEDELPITPETVLRPVNPYAVTKIAQDMIGYVYYRSYGLQVYRTRTFNHEGPRRDKVFGIPWYAYQVARIEAGKQSPLILTGDIDDKRNFTHVHDIVRAYWLSVHKCDAGELYLVGSDEDDKVYTFKEALEQIIDMSTVKGIKHQKDSQYIRPTTVPFLIGDTSKFREKTGWKPEIGFEQILTETLDYWRGIVGR